MHLFNAGQDDALITVTCFSFSTFWELLDLFTPIYLCYIRHVMSGSNITQLPFHCQSRMWQLTPTVALGLVLAWTRKHGLRCVTASFKVCEVWKKDFTLLFDGCRGGKNKASETDDMIQIFREVIWTRYPTVQHCWGSIDGVKFQIENPGDDVWQSHFYNGWIH
jgi:hypothetical protein